MQRWSALARCGQRPAFFGHPNFLPTLRGAPIQQQTGTLNGKCEWSSARPSSVLCFPIPRGTSLRLLGGLRLNVRPGAGKSGAHPCRSIFVPSNRCRLFSRVYPFPRILFFPYNLGVWTLGGRVISGRCLVLGWRHM